MLDRFAYTAMTGAKQSMGQLGNTSNNLANAQTPGFREMVDVFRAAPIKGAGADSRAFVSDTTPGSVFNPGPIQATGNPFDVAIKGTDGFFVVQRDNGTEAYTRSGQFMKDNDGYLRQGKNLVVGLNGAINIPQDVVLVNISEEGKVYGKFQYSEQMLEIDQLRLVNMPSAALKRAADGLFELPDGAVAEVDDTMRVQQGALEQSNVSVTSAMVQMINQMRMFELNTRFIQTADQNARAANVLMSLSRN